MKSRYLSAGEKRDVAVSVIEILKLQNPDCHVHVNVDDQTDDRGVPQYTATITTKKPVDTRPNENADPH